MRARAIGALNSRSDPAFFGEIAEGLGLIQQHAHRLSAGAADLSERIHGRASSVLAIVAAEEAAKYLILLDAIRCPVQPPKRRVRQLRRFNDHLAKGIYARTAGIRPAEMKELLGYSKMLRRQFYLDGPEGIEWIFRNEVHQQREEALYVDFVEADGELTWWSPNAIADSDTFARLFTPPPAVTLVNSLHNSGFSQPRALAIVAKVWRPSEWLPESKYPELRGHILRTLEHLDAEGVLTGETADHQRIPDSWTFPLFDQDLQEIEVSKKELEQRRQNYTGW